MNKLSFALVTAVLLLCIFACDSPKWSKVFVANVSESDLTVRLKVPYSSDACLYSPDQWKRYYDVACTPAYHAVGAGGAENFFDIVVPPGGAVEIESGRHPDIEQDPEGFFLVDRLDLIGGSGNRSWSGRKQIFDQFTTEGTSLLYLQGKSPRYVYYYK